MARKTVKVAEVVGYANRILTTSTTTREERLGVIGLLETVLNDADAYAGFNYQPSEFAPDGAGLLPDYDDTRRTYYVKASIR